MDVSNPGYGGARTDGAVVYLEGALKPPDFARKEFPTEPGNAMASEIEAVVDLSEDLQEGGVNDIVHPFASKAGQPSGDAPTLRPSGVAEDLPDDPIVTPPVYGGRHADVARVRDAQSQAKWAWLRELNLDPRNRAAAGLGTEVVRQRQEEFMERAWNQVGEVEAANQRLREAELAMAAAEAVFDKHTVGSGADRIMTLTVAAQHGLRSGAANRSIRGLIVESRVPVAAQTAAFKRVTRPQRKFMRRLTGMPHVAGFQNNLLTNMNQVSDQAISAARPRSEPDMAVGIDVVTTAVSAGIVEFASLVTPTQLFIQLLYENLHARRASVPPEDLTLLTIAGIKATLRAALAVAIPANAPAARLETARHVTAIIDAITSFNIDAADTVRVTVRAATFDTEFGESIAGKTFKGVTIISDAASPDSETVRATCVGDLQQYQAALNQFHIDIVTGKPLPPARPALAVVGTIAKTVLPADASKPSRN